MSKHYTLIVGSMLGASEYVADALAEQLREAGHQVSIELEPDLTTINPGSIWVVITSTHGAGDLPDNIQSFAAQLKSSKLSQVNAFVIGLGDSSYDTFCYGAKTIETLLQQSGATLLDAPLHIDVLDHPIPEEKAVEWFESRLA
ncbi:FMN-binding protein MioC [Alteromonas aestuariivivens]|uniref:FMN-binding protein MioC n=1 Tax=Alteromonas aestuariivivens TaxID=1938339 RepID=A0A3D8M5A5_9ALTE|nr:FMN-binding protein MioC [Alteromonas aestuariivivens]RDV24788.1 FMN-binding protein MioC [Alteromonas aestuariivivens]